MRKIVMVALLLAGCAQPIDVKAREEAAFVRYRGHHVSDIAVRLGPPEQAINRPQGTIYTFTGQANTQVLTNATTTAPVTVSCRVIVYTDEASIIIGLNYSGVPQACAEMYGRLQ